MKPAVVTVVFSGAFGLLTPVLAQQVPSQTPPGTVQTPPGGAVQTGPGRGRPTPPQPQQKSGPEYLIGTWTFNWTGRESAVTSGPRSGTVTFARRSSGSGDVLDIRSEGTSGDTGAAFKETGSAEWNDTRKTLTLKERLANGAQLSGVGDWSSALAIRYQSEPLRAGTETVRVRRTYAILSPHSFTLEEELSVDGGPYRRLGRGAFSKH